MKTKDPECCLRPSAAKEINTFLKIISEKNKENIFKKIKITVTKQVVCFEQGSEISVLQIRQEILFTTDLGRVTRKDQSLFRT